MRAIVLVSLTLAALVLTETAAGAGSWCAFYPKRGSENCTYTSYEQCRATAWGTGGYCRPNPFPGTAFGTSSGSWGSPPKRGY